MKTEISPSGKYKLEIALTEKIEGYWQDSIAKIYTASDEFISIVHRNYPQFPFVWVENHADGHDYLICGEDYQGQTVIQLDTKLRKDYIPSSAKKGMGFCWVELEVHEDKLRVYGCYWGAPFEYVEYDFSSPMNLPYTELDRWDEENDDED